MSKQLQIPGIGGILPGELIVDLFAGGGGASLGIEMALGRSPDIAINHDPHAIQMHELNHPATTHHCQSVFHREVHPLTLVHGIDPCDLPRYITHSWRRFKYDRAAPVGQRLTQRVGLLWLSPDCRHFSKARGGAPVSASVRALCWIGLRWAKFVRPRVVILENVPEFVTAGPLLADGKPDPARKGEHFRAFVREWKSYGYTITWQKLVCCYHGARTTRERLFMVMRCDGEANAFPIPSEKPAGTAGDCIDWSIPCPSIFMTREEAREYKRRTGVQIRRPLAEKTMRRIARGVAKYVLNGKPFIMPITHSRDAFRGRPIDQPMPTITTAHRGELALVAPTLVQTGYGEREGQEPRCLDLQQPLGTVVAGGAKHALVAAFLAKHNGGHEATGQSLTDPIHTVTGTDTKAVVAAHLEVMRNNAEGVAMSDPVPSLTAGGGTMAIVAAFLQHYYSEGGQDQDLADPMHTVPTRARHSVITVQIDGTTYAIVDIGMRMLTPRELARAQSFPDSFILTGNIDEQIARIGNSVPPEVACAMVSANFPKPKAVKRRRVA